MPHGHPDYGAEAVVETIHGIQDMAELAVRLGSVDTFDRRGNVVWFDSFEDGIEKWNKSLGGTNAKIEWSAESTKTGGFSAKLTGGSSAGGWAAINQDMHLPVLGKTGFEFSFNLDDNLHLLRLYILLSKGIYSWRAYIRYDYDTRKLQYSEDGGVWLDIATNLELLPYSHIYHTLKFVIDYTNHRLVRLILNDTSYDLSDISFPTHTGADVSRLLFVISNYPASGTNGVVYIDNFILTQNEI